MREGEEQGKKKGWFARRRSTAPTAGPNASRPPSVSSFPRHKRSPAADKTAAADDDDLPPREGSSTTPAPTTGTTTPATPDDSGDIASEIPAHAGFDLAAMKAAIGESERNPRELAMPDVPRVAIPQVPPHDRAMSAPPLDQDSPEITPTAPTPRDYGHIAAGSSGNVNGLASTFSRSLSLNDMQRLSEDEEEEDEEEEGDDAVTSRHTAAHAAQGPTLSFAGTDGAVWTPAPPEEDALYTGFGVAGRGGLGAFGSPHAFGAAPEPESERADPWSSFAAGDAKKLATYTSNPWDS